MTEMTGMFRKVKGRMKLFIIEDETPIREELTQFFENMVFNARAARIFMT